MTAPGSSSPSGPLEPRAFARALGKIYRERRDGILELEGPDAPRPLYFRDGLLYLDRVHDFVPAVEDVLRETPARGPWADETGSAPLLAAATRRIPFDGGLRFVFREDLDEVPEGAVGPLPTYLLAGECAISGRRELELLSDLGGEEAVLRTVPEPGGDRLPPLDGQGRRLLSRLADPLPLKDLFRLRLGARGDVIRQVVALEALGLVAPAATPRPGDRRPKTDDLVPRFLERIEASLAERPLAIDPAEQRALIRTLLAAGGATHYELLGIPVDAPPDRVARAFEMLGRRVHPAHASSLGVEQGEAVLRLLFERATHAYVTLSDPARRREYDLEVGATLALESRSEEEVAATRRAMARSNFDRARGAIRVEDFHTAVELLRDAVRWDPQAEYLGLLGETEARNPKWLDDAIGNLKEAIRLNGREPLFRLRLAEAYEKMGRENDAVREYEAALELSPGLPAAEEALARLRPPPPPSLLDRLLAALGLGRKPE